MTKTNDRLNRLIRYFEDSKPEDAIWVCWFSGNRIKGAIKTGELRNFLARTKLPIWLIEECHDQRDLAETISLLAGSESESSSSGLDQIIPFLLPLRGMYTDERMERLDRAWDFLSMEEMLPFHKLLTGDFGWVYPRVTFKALAVVAKVEPAVIAQRIAGNWNWDELTMEEILDPDEDEEEINRPFHSVWLLPCERTKNDRED